MMRVMGLFQGEGVMGSKSSPFREGWEPVNDTEYNQILREPRCRD